jgi:spore coat-associated protein N
MVPAYLLTTTATLTGTAPVASGQIATANVDIATAPAATLLTATDLAPGEVIVAPVTVTNTGTLAARYAVSATSSAADTAGLGAHLTATIRLGVSACTAAGATASGTALYGPGPLAATGGRVLVGDPTAGAQAGDRLLGVGQAETLCVAISRPPESPTSFNGKSASVSLAFIAEQIASNP